MPKEILPYDWAVDDYNGECIVHIWGHQVDSQRICLRVRNFHPFIRMQLPRYTLHNVPLFWNYEKIAHLLKFVNNSMKEHPPIRYECEKKRKLLYYTDDKHEYITFYFPSLESMTHFNNLIQGKELEIYEVGNISLQLVETSFNVIDKFVISNKLTYANWIRFEGQPTNNVVRKGTLEYEVSIDDITLLPDMDELPDVKVLCFDIETYSKVHGRMSQGCLISDCITMVSLVSRYLISGKEERKILIVNGECGDIEGVDVRRCEDEESLLAAFVDAVVELDPSILTGYNVNNFDLSYFNDRFEIYNREWPNISCLRNYKTSFTSKAWGSSAFKKVYRIDFRTEGRLTLDMYLVMYREYGTRLMKHTLDYVSKHFLGRGKHDVSPREMFETYDELCAASTPEELEIAKQKQARVGAYCIEDSALTIDLMKKVNTYINLIQFSREMMVPMVDIYTRGQQRRLKNCLYNFTFFTDIVIDIQYEEDDMEVKGAHVVDPIPGKYSNIPTLDFTSLYPSIIIAYNLCYSTVLPTDTEIPEHMYNAYKWREETKSGAVYMHEYRVIKKEYYEGVLPKMCAGFIGKRNVVKKKMKGLAEDSFLYQQLDSRQNAIKASNNSVYGVTNSEGDIKFPVLSRLVTYFGRESNRICRDYLLKNYNSLTVYGDTDSVMPDLQIDDPREIEDIGKRIAKEITDEINAPPMSLEYEKAFFRAIYISKKCYAAIKIANIKKSEIQSSDFMGIVHDKYHLYKFVIQFKNKDKILYMCLDPRYMDDKYVFHSGFYCDSNGGIATGDYIFRRGILSARRDRSAITFRTYDDILIKILLDRPLHEIIEFIDDVIIAIMQRFYPCEDFIVTKQVGTYKETARTPMKTFKDILLRNGTALDVGERVEYVFIDVPEKLQGRKMMLWKQFLEAREEGIHLDYVHYIEKEMATQITKLIYLAYGKETEEANVQYKASRGYARKYFSKVCSDYMKTWVKRIRVKQELIDDIRRNKYHFVTQTLDF